MHCRVLQSGFAALDAEDAAPAAVVAPVGEGLLKADDIASGFNELPQSPHAFPTRRLLNKSNRI